MKLPIVLVRFSEIALKAGNTRLALKRLLRHNTLTALKINGVQFDRIEDTWERLIIHTDESTKAAEVSSKVFGVASTSPAIECISQIEAFCEIVSSMAREKLKAGGSFAVRVRRIGRHGFTTNEIAVKCGSSVIKALENVGTKIAVNLDSPDYEFFVEVRGERTFVYSVVIRGVGGLPIGSQGKVVSLLDDFESILATWLMMKRGCVPILVHFGSTENQNTLINITRSSLFPYSGGKLPIIKLPLEEIIGDTRPAGLIETCLKFLCIAHIAKLQRAEGIVSSERFESSARAHDKMAREFVSSLDLPVFYPLVGLDDKFVGSLAQRVGGELLATKIRIEDDSRRKLLESRESEPTCNLNSIMDRYQDKMKEAVVDALTRAGI